MSEVNNELSNVELIDMAKDGWILSAVNEGAYYFMRETKVKNLAQPDVSGSLPNEIDLLELKKLLRFSDRYEISIQFWPEQIAVYIAKDGVELTDFGGDFDFAIGKSIEYLVRITGGNDR